MIDFGKEWNALFTAGGALLPLEEKAEAAVKQVFARAPGAREYVAESAGADMKEFFDALETNWVYRVTGRVAETALGPVASPPSAR